MNAKYLLPIAVLCLGSTSCGNDNDEFVVDPDTAVTPLKVMSFNLRYSTARDDINYGGDRLWSARRQPCVDLIKDENPDLIGMQEVQVDQQEDLNQLMGDVYGHYTARDEGIDAAHTGHTVIYYNKIRFRLLDKGFFWLSPTPDELSRPGWGAQDTQYRTTAWVKLHDNDANRDLFFYTTHLPYIWEDRTARTECVNLNVKRMKEKAGREYPVFITGDMNTSSAAADAGNVSLAGYQHWMWDARKYNINPKVYSYNGYGLAKPSESCNLDHIFYRNVTPLKFWVCNSADYGVEYVSDHYPIVFECRY